MAIKLIEVTGEGEYQEQIQYYVLDITIEVRAKTDALAVEETNKLKDRCIECLLEHGITSDEITYGGLEIWRPWYQKKKVEKYAQHTFTLRVGDRDRLGKAVDQMAKLFDEDRFHVAMSMRPPLFEEKEQGVDKAIKAAYQDALRKAKLIAGEAGKEIGSMTKAIELSKAKRKLTGRGDIDFRAENGRASGSIGFAASLGKPDPDAVPLSERSIWLTYKFTFEIKKEEEPDKDPPKAEKPTQEASTKEQENKPKETKKKRKKEPKGSDT
ncbi:MAG: SIMPL domain-containing protein [Bacteroidota bacterium]